MPEPYTDPTFQAALDGLYDRAAQHGYRPRPIAGLAVGGCCDAFGTTRQGAFRKAAHAHTSGSHLDWICVRSRRPERLITPTGKPTALLIHEYAHVLMHAGHVERWRKAVTDLGAPAEARMYAGRK